MRLKLREGKKEDEITIPIAQKQQPERQQPQQGGQLYEELKTKNLTTTLHAATYVHTPCEKNLHQQPYPTSQLIAHSLTESIIGEHHQRLNSNEFRGDFFFSDN